MTPTPFDQSALEGLIERATVVANRAIEGLTAQDVLFLETSEILIALLRALKTEGGR